MMAMLLMIILESKQFSICAVILKIINKTLYKSIIQFNETILSNIILYTHRYGSNLSTGLFLEHDDVFKIVEGKNTYWYHLKNRIKTHLGCTGDNAKTHIEALKVCRMVLCN